MSAERSTAPPNLRLLVIDDSPSIHADFRKILQPEDRRDAAFDDLRARLFAETSRRAAAPTYEVEYALQGQEALSLVERATAEGRPYALAFLDVRMPPGWDGIETCERLWRVDPDLQVVLATAHSDHPWEEILARLGGSDRLLILKKPFDSVEIRQLAATLTAKWELVREARTRVADLEERVQEKTRDLALANERLRAQIDEVTLAEEMARASAARLEQSNKELVRAHEAAESANRAKSDFLSNMSHEIRTPMTAILGYADLLCEPEMPREEIAQHVRTIQRNRDHLLKLVNDILDLSKIEAGAMSIEHLPSSPGEILREVVAMMQLRAAEKQVSLSYGARGPIPETIVTDPTRLRQILLNLVANAIKFTEKGGVHVHARIVPPEEGENARMAFDVTDTGIGMREEQMEHLFHPFSQADSSVTRRFGGSGLGLSISLRLAKLMGGSITAQSREGSGSTFTLTVDAGPLDGVRLVAFEEIADETADDNETWSRFAPRLSGRILLAEDGRDNQRLITLYLTRAGATVEIAEDGAEAVAKATAALAAGEPHDLILMDMQMPSMDGYTATGKLRQSGFSGPIVALTAHAMTGDRERCIDAGCSEYAIKPIDRLKLIAICARLMSTGERIRAPLPSTRPKRGADAEPEKAQKRPRRPKKPRS
jgi:signal transduction histidine kinase/DNA-binding NarL/FixJ family response regulator